MTITPDGYTRVGDFLECNACGAVVNRPDDHDEWHDALVATLEGIERQAAEARTARGDT